MRNKNVRIFGIFLWCAVAALLITLFVSTYMRLIKLNETLTWGTLPHPRSIDYGYAKRPVLTLLHILPGVLLVVLGALQFVKTIRNRYTRLHRWIGRIYILLGIGVGISSIFMGFFMRFGGLPELLAVIIFSIYFLAALFIAYKSIRQRAYDRHREWMIRAFALALAVATMRPVIGLFFAFTNIPFHQFFGYVFWIAFILHIIVAEWWIWMTKPRANRSLYSQ